ncbi:MAG: hypothetical protein PF630_06800 [Gammaproteobacteria bacterium]|jgi:hypothetical protein|nr:hypothetical protein [Gammaproteobacteria bacterium]
MTMNVLPSPLRSTRVTRIVNSLWLTAALFIANPTVAGNAFLSCEGNSIDGFYLCFLTPDTGVSLESVHWGATSPLFLDQILLEGQFARFLCDGSDSGGSLRVSFLTTDGMSGSASRNTDCPNTGSGGGDFCNAGNHHCGEPPVPPPPCNPEVEFCGLPQGADGTQ